MPKPPTHVVDRWLNALPGSCSAPSPLGGDVSTRSYYRCQYDGRSSILAHYPGDLDNAFQRFLQTSELLREIGLPVPRVLHQDAGEGFMLLEDVGAKTLYEQVLSGEEATPWIDRAASYLPRLQTISSDSMRGLLPPLDSATLDRELSVTWEVFLQPSGLTGPGERLRKALSTLCQELASPKLIPCHRDFMARNLVLDRAGDRLVVIDHQDLRLGPVFYDLASLLNDSLFAPTSLESRLLALYAPSESLELSYHRAVVQRGLKAIGTFRRFADRGHRRHLPLIAPTLKRVWDRFDRIPELRPLRPHLESSWAGFLSEPPPLRSVDSEPTSS